MVVMKPNIKITLKNAPFQPRHTGRCFSIKEHLVFTKTDVHNEEIFRHNQIYVQCLKKTSPTFLAVSLESIVRFS